MTKFRQNADLFVRLLRLHSMKWKIFIEPIVEAVMGQFPIEAGTISWIAAIRTIFGGSVYMNKTFNQLLCKKWLNSRCKDILEFGMISHRLIFFKKKKSA